MQAANGITPIMPPSENNNYILRLSGFSGNVEDSLTWYHGGMKFANFDLDNDNWGGNCAQATEDNYGGGGWWFNVCRLVCLTCPFNGPNFRWNSMSIRSARMMIKSK